MKTMNEKRFPHAAFRKKRTMKYICFRCGLELVSKTKSASVCVISPCEQCLDDQYEVGHNDGFYSGVDEANSEAKNKWIKKLSKNKIDEEE